MNPQPAAPWLENQWYQAAWLHELDATPLLSRTILGRAVLLFRDASGTLGALEDRCPHRFAPLSAGTLQDGLVRCGYHGLAFDATGRCRHNPHGPIGSALRVASFPVLERHQAAWVWMGTQPADPAMLAPLDFIDQTPDTAKFFGYMDTAANYQLLSDNILDLSHADYLHPGSLGGIMTGARSSVREHEGGLTVQWLSADCVPPPAFLSMVPPPSRADIWTEVHWRAPALMVLGTGANAAGTPRDPANEAITLHNMTPATSQRTHYFFCSTRKFNTQDAPFNRMLAGLITAAFQNEDKPMLEKQQRSIGTADFWSLKPALLGIDAAAVRVRRLLEKLIDEEQAARPQSESVTPFSAQVPS